MKRYRIHTGGIKDLLSSPRFTTTLILATIIVVLFNFNFDVNRTGAAVVAIIGEGSPGFISKWVPSSFLPFAFHIEPDPLPDPVQLNVAGSIFLPFEARKDAGGFDEPVTFSHSGFPGGPLATEWFPLINPCIFVPTCNVVLKVDANGAPRGSHPIRIDAISASLSASDFDTFTLDIVTQCSDGKDNDGDVIFDCTDPACWVDPTDPIPVCDPDDNEEGAVPPELVLDATPDRVRVGRASIVEWTVSDPSAVFGLCTIEGVNSEGTVDLNTTIDPSPGSGTYNTVSIDEPTIYTFSCTDEKGNTVIATTVVNVLPVFEEF